MAEEKIMLKRSQFACPKCIGEDRQGAFLFFATSSEYRENDNGEFVATCPQCGIEVPEVFYCAQLRTAKRTGAKTEAGRAKVRMNRFTTGSRYKSGAIPKYLPPAKPGKFPECDDCQDLEECKEAVEDAMGTCAYVACHRKTEIFSKYRQAHISGDPEALRMDMAELQARLQMVANACFKQIFDRGVMIERAVYQDGKQVGTESVINPSVNEVLKIMDKGGYSLTDWVLTPKSKEAKAALEGYLAGQAAAKGQTMDEFMAKHNADMKSFHDALARGNEQVKVDATLKESEQEAENGE